MNATNRILPYTAMFVLAVGITWFAANGFDIDSTLGNSSSGSTQPEAPKSEIYIAFQPNSPETASLSEQFQYSVSRQARGNQRFVIDVLKDSKAENIYSNRASRRAIQGLRPKLDSNPSTYPLDPVPSNNQALIQSFQRVKDLTVENAGRYPLHAYIVTSGTTDPTTIATIHEICKQLSQTNISNVRVNLVGLTPENRVPMSTALKPIGSIAASAGTNYDEWLQLVRKF